MGIKRVTMSYANWSKKVVTMEDKELKERFFALYWNQPVFKFYGHDDCVPENVYGSLAYGYEEKGYLELKPLHSISDDLKKELFEKVNGIASALLGRNLTADIDYLLENAEIGFVNSFVVDFLRCHGFAIQWMGISVEEQVQKGWIKLVE